MDFDRDIQMEDVGDDSIIIMSDDKQNAGFANMPSMARAAPGELSPKSLNQLDAWIEQLSQCRPLTEEEVDNLCNMVC